MNSTRARPTALAIVAAALLVARIAVGLHDARHPAPAGGLVRWTPLLGVEQDVAAEGKPILYDFTASWCEPCKKMEREVLSDASAAAFINDSYVAVRVADDDTSAGAAMLRARYQVSSLPTLLVVSRAAKELRRTEGYPGKRRVMAFLRGNPTGPGQETPR